MAGRNAITGFTNEAHDSEEYYRKKTGERIKALIKERNTTQKALAELLRIGESSLRGYISGRQSLPLRVARDIENATGVMHLYWMGQTDCQTWDEYWAESDRAEQDRIDALEKELAAVRSSRENLFSLLGYAYQDRTGEAEFDFDGVVRTTQTQGRAFVLTDMRQPKADAAFFSDEELQDLFRRIRDTVDLACYQQIKKGAVKHGND